MQERLRVVVVESDGPVRAALTAVLCEAGCLVVAVAEVSLVRPLLRVSPHPLVVVLGYSRYSPDHQEVQALLRRVGQWPPHAYVVLSTLPHQAPTAVYNPHTQRTVPVLPTPWDVDALRRCVAEAARQLALVAAPVALAG